jgi:glycosyltransferase involved in cell wall biosynthesis
VRFLFINNHCITDPTAGVTRSLWTILRWLAEAEHEVRALTTARFESPVTFSLDAHLESLKVRVHWDHQRKSQQRKLAAAAKAGKRRVAHFHLKGVAVTLLATRANDEATPDPFEQVQYLRLFSKLCDDFQPDQVIAANGHPMIWASLAAARGQGVTNVFAVRGFGYDRAEMFRDVHHVFTCSKFLSQRFLEETGLPSTPLDPPLVWSEIIAPANLRKFLTFVNPSPHKGAMFFAGLAKLLGEKRPDIPILVVQSGRSAELLNNISGVDFTKFPQMMASPPVDRPSEFFALTRVLLVPSVWEEPFGRVAAEAMINGIPALVSDRGGLPDVVGCDGSDGGGAIVLRIRADFTKFTTSLPDTAALEPWYNAVCRLWDDGDFYQRVAKRAKQIADDRYREDVLRAAHVRYFESLPPSGPTLPERELPKGR